ncbi:MAG TPA: hypothetical protein VKQ11_00535 [Candidatus Sulfotelmatobacter sp.]|nr:hypothetical protein [Candidatus Sulfotelmatobacter sp.]
MTLQVWFWLFMALWLVFGIWRGRTDGWPFWGGHFLLFVLFAILGWQVFGSPVK